MSSNVGCICSFDNNIDNDKDILVRVPICREILSRGRIYYRLNLMSRIVRIRSDTYIYIALTELLYG